jgi:uncharacterized membrane protein YedE/YeeE
MRLVFAALSGGLFGLGLLVAGMLDTAKVQGFLDLGAWDPTLAFVMGGAILPMAVAWRIARPVSLLGTPTPERLLQVIDARLVAGSALFGAGWALVGLCPGPSLAVLGFGGMPAFIFFVAMGAGMIASRLMRAAFRPA